MVLSACSPYFQAMLYNTPDRHPIVFLRDVRFHEMKALLEFMYRGEVSVDQENLSSLLKVAEGLKIKGLADVNDTNAPSSSSSARPSAYMGSSLLSPHHQNDLSSPMKRMSSPPAGSGPSSYVGPKRKRARPRRLSGSEAVPMASGLAEESSAAAAAAAAAAAVAVAAASRPLEVQTEEGETTGNREKVNVKSHILSTILRACGLGNLNVISTDERQCDREEGATRSRSHFGKDKSMH